MLTVLNEANFSLLTLSLASSFIKSTAQDVSEKTRENQNLVKHTCRIKTGTHENPHSIKKGSPLLPPLSLEHINYTS